MTENIKILLDTDIGDDIDDAFAIALLCKLPGVCVEAVTTVYRNSVQRARIAGEVLRYFDAAIPVYAGEDKPIKEPVFIAPFETVGADGKPDIPHYEPFMDRNPVGQEYAPDRILQLLEQYPRQLVLVGIGPLTNLAAAFHKAPDTFKKAKELLVMGGQAEGTFAEWNIKCDPEAADIVFRSGVPVRLVTLECTKPCEFTPDDIREFEQSDIPVNALLYKMMHKWMTDSKRSHLPIMYDGLAVSCLTQSFCVFETMRLRVGLTGSERGKLIIEEGGTPVTVSTRTDKKAFMTYFKQMLLSAK